MTKRHKTCSLKTNALGPIRRKGYGGCVLSLKRYTPYFKENPLIVRNPYPAFFCLLFFLFEPSKKGGQEILRHKL